MSGVDCDVLVVGAGPAGSAAARAAAEAGVDVLLADRRQTVGMPVRCAEYVPAQLIGDLNLGRDFVVQSIKGMKTFLPNGQSRTTPSKGFMIRRDRLDQRLAEAAAIQGARQMFRTRVVGRETGGAVVARKEDKPQERFEIRARVIIGADGPHSTVGRLAGTRNTNMLVGVQVRMPLEHPQQYTEIYFEPDIFGGYGWFFPKKTAVNIGVGMRPPAVSGKSPQTVLKDFVRRFLDQKRVSDRVLHRTGGWIPAGPLRSAVCRDVILAGDAAGHTHPVTGAGIFSAVTCGEMAGRWAAIAVKANDLSLLREYDNEWQDLFGSSLQRGYERRIHMESHWQDLSRTIKKTWVAYREYYA